MSISPQINNFDRLTSPKLPTEVAQKVKRSNKDQVKGILLSHAVNSQNDHHFVLTHSKFQGVYTNQDNEVGGEGMDEAAKAMLERLERDSREREERYHDDAKDREQRYHDQLLEQDQRFRQEAKEREERIMASINDLKTDLKNDFKEVKDESRTTRNTVLALTISVVLGVAAMVVAIVISV